MKSNFVSVIVPVYNGLHFIQAALNSVLNQTFTNWECIVVDDGSFDGSYEKALRFQSEFPDRFRVLRQKNSGQARARNFGVDNASGEFIAFLDCDDVWHEEKLAIQVKALSGNDDLLLSLTSYSITQRRRPRRVIRIRSIESLTRDWSRCRGYGGGLESVGLVKAGLVKDLRFDEDLSTSSGLDLFLRIKDLGGIHLSKKVLMEYRKYPGQWHGNFSELKRNVYQIYKKHFSNEFNLYVADFERYERLVNLKSGLSAANLPLVRSSFQIEDTPYLAMRFYKYLYSVFAGLSRRGL
jgi:glycosyltransferase involved in cell wall biosynthesis